MSQPPRVANRDALAYLRDWRFGTGIHRRDRIYVIRGTVEYNRDPEHRGRIMVRVVEDGPEMQFKNKEQPRVATFDLGWCDPLFNQGAGMGFGAFNVPPVGSRVFVMYERGETTNPIYFGGWYANSPRQRRYGATKTTLKPPINDLPDKPGYDENGHAGGDYVYPPKPTPYGGFWMEQQRPEIPIELVEMEDNTPDIQMFFKTLKGATLIAKERDTVEELMLIDRLGAELRFESNTQWQENGVLRRGMNSATQLAPLALGSLNHASHKVSLLTAIQSGLVMEANKYGDDSTTLQAHAEPATVIRNTELFPTRMAVELDQGQGRLRVVYLDGGTEVGAITFDVVARRLDIHGIERMHITSSEEIMLEAPSIRIRGDLEVDGEIRHLGGEKFTFLDNDTAPYDSQMRNFWDITPAKGWEGFRKDEDVDRW